MDVLTPSRNLPLLDVTCFCDKLNIVTRNKLNVLQLSPYINALQNITQYIWYMLDDFNWYFCVAYSLIQSISAAYF
jgi:hypothetical protein